MMSILDEIETDVSNIIKKFDNLENQFKKLNLSQENTKEILKAAKMINDRYIKFFEEFKKEYIRNNLNR